MKDVYVILRNMLLFFFLVAIFDGTIVVMENTVVDKTLVGLGFGLVMMLLPNMLKFFKLPVNNGSMLLLGVIVSFAFYFVGLYLMDFVAITGNYVNLGISDINIKFEDRTVALVVLSVTSALASVFLDTMSKGGKRKSA